MITAGVDLIHEKYEKGIHSAKKMSAVILLSCFKVHIPNGGDAPTNLRSAQTLANSAQGVIRPGIISIQVRGCYSLQLQGKLYSPSSGPSFFVAPSSFLEHSATSSKPDLFSRPTWRKPSVSQCIGSEGRLSSSEILRVIRRRGLSIFPTRTSRSCAATQLFARFQVDWLRIASLYQLDGRSDR